MQTVNIASAVDDMAQSRPDEVAIFEPTGSSVEQQATYRRWTYRELEAASNEIAAGLLELGLQKGDRTALMVTPSLELFGLTFGLFKAGIVPVMLASMVPWGLAFAAANSMQQVRLAAAAPPFASATVSLNTSSLYIGQAIGSGIGGALFAQDMFHAIGYVSVGCMVLAVMAVVLSRRQANAQAAVSR